jgi:hypothetical protein
MEQIRNMAFEPLNTTLGTTFPLGGPDKFRQDIYEANGDPSIYGMELVNVYDLGKSRAYNILFSNYAGSKTYEGYGKSGTAVFSPGSEEVVIGIDKRQDFLARLVENNPDDNSTLTVQADTQFTNRSESVGFFARVREGRVGLDGRNVVTMIF